ncbi:MAG TPA: hypothetical protein VIK66_15095 [Gaiellaceae bacterium]|jgi:hypothetical protein
MKKKLHDRWELKVQPDGTVGECYFCGVSVKRGEDFAVMVVERVEPKGEPIHAVCHGTCAERAKGL